MGLRFEHLKTFEDLSHFQEEASLFVDVNLPLHYLRNGKVVALVSRKSQKKVLHGGFVISHHSLRSIMQIPTGDKELVQDKFTRRISRSFEINGLWIDKKTTPGALAIAIWLALAYEMFRMGLRGKYYFIYSYDSSKKHLGALYSTFRPVQIYAGRVLMLEGMTDEANEVIESCSLKNLFRAMITTPEFYLKRLFRPAGGR